MKLKLICALGLGLWMIAASESASAGALALRFGPLSTGTGGSNPVGIPPSIRDLGLSYISKTDLEYNASLTTFSLAKRDKAKWGGYVSLGAGLAFSRFGGGFGPYAAFGYEGGCLFKRTCFTAEYQQSLAIASGMLISPYSLRIGVLRWF